LILQHTIEKPVSCEGVGLHTGERSLLEFRPADEDSGIYFISSGKKITAIPENITNTQRGSTLSTIWTVEHVLSAVYGLGIDNIEIYIEGCEPPAMDGSAKGFVDVLKFAGIRKQSKEAGFFELSEKIEVGDADRSISIEPFDRLLIEAAIDYSPSFVGMVSAKYDEASDNYEKDVAPARTFGFLNEFEALKKQGLARGASFDNAIAVLDSGYSTPLRYDNELARHKILDIIGDMALAGKRLKGKIVSRKAGHKLNVELARRLLHASS